MPFAGPANGTLDALIAFEFAGSKMAAAGTSNSTASVWSGPGWVVGCNHFEELEHGSIFHTVPVLESLLTTPVTLQSSEL